MVSTRDNSAEDSGDQVRTQSEQDAPLTLEDVLSHIDSLDWPEASPEVQRIADLEALLSVCGDFVQHVLTTAGLDGTGSTGPEQLLSAIRAAITKAEDTK